MQYPKYTCIVSCILHEDMQGCINVNVPKLAITSDQPVNPQGAKATFIIFI